jgi:hypothetical protein
MPTTSFNDELGGAHMEVPRPASSERFLCGVLTRGKDEPTPGQTDQNEQKVLCPSLVRPSLVF